MANRSVRRFAAHRQQRGQALIYGLFMLFAGLAGLYFMFNTGQVVRAKTKLVTTADAAAYSGGLMHARALNYHAYINRALMADEVLIAQTVSMASWASYVDSWSDNLSGVHLECDGMAKIQNGDYYAALVSLVLSLRKFGLDYAFACGIMEMDRMKEQVIPFIVNTVRETAPTVVQVTEAHKVVLKGAPPVLHAMFLGERHRVMQAVADANYEGDGKVLVDMATSMDDWTSGPGGPFVRLYSDDERTRFKGIAVNAAHSDPFVKDRGWTSESVMPELSCLAIGTWRKNRVDRRGGTEMLGLDEWHAVDTQSYHYHYASWGWSGPKCKHRETKTGYAQQEAYDDEAQSPSGMYGGAPYDNPAAYAEAVGGGFGFGFGGFGGFGGSGGEKINYSGLPSYYDLNASWFNGANRDEEPLLRHAVRLTRAKTHLHTTDAGGGQIRTRSDSRIAAYDTTLADGVMAAVSGTETFFERPPGFEKNVWGAKSNKPMELGSLFNPYWHTRLVEGDVAAQWLQQGVVRP